MGLFVYKVSKNKPNKKWEDISFWRLRLFIYKTGNVFFLALLNFGDISKRNVSTQSSVALWSLIQSSLLPKKSRSSESSRRCKGGRSGDLSGDGTHTWLLPCVGPGLVLTQLWGVGAWPPSMQDWDWGGSQRPGAEPWMPPSLGYGKHPEGWVGNGRHAATPWNGPRGLRSSYLNASHQRWHPHVLPDVFCNSPPTHTT